MIKTKLILFIPISFAWAMGAGAVTIPKNSEEKIVAQKNNASFYTEIPFTKGSSDLNTEAKAKLTRLLDQAKSKGTIDDVKVISWADSEYPSPAKKKLSSKQRDLAARRGKTLKSFIKDSAKQATVDSYNMAERPTTLQKLLATSDSRIKKSLEDAGIPTTANNLKVPENAAQSMVMIILKR